MAITRSPLRFTERARGLDGGERPGDGFTLVEMIVVVLVIAVVTAMGAAKFSDIATQSRMQGCAGNQNAILSAVKTWEARHNVVIADDGTNASIRFDQSGNITSASGQPVQLGVGSNDIGAIAGAADTFVCPERLKALSGDLGARAESDYEFLALASPTSNPRGIEINYKRLGVACLTYGRTGPDGTPQTAHR